MTAVPIPGIPLPMFWLNGTNALKNATLTFYCPGIYTLAVTIRYSASL